MKTTVREASGGVQIVDLKGKITIGAGDVQLRETINHLVDAGKKNILIDMRDVTTIDSSGIGELVGCYTSVTNKGEVEAPPPAAQGQRRVDGHAAHHRLRRLRVGAGSGGELRGIEGRFSEPSADRVAASALRPFRRASAPVARKSARGPSPNGR